MNLFSKTRLVCALGFAGLCSVSMGAVAQTSSAATTAASPEPGITIGAGLVIGPEYYGAKKERFLLAPFFSYRNANGFYAGTNEGVGFSTKVNSFQLGAGIGYRAGRADSSEDWSFKRGSDDLKGMGDIAGALTVRLKGAYQFGSGATVSLSSEMALNHRETGNTYTLGLKMPLYESKSDQVSLNMGATYGDRKFNQSNFGVTTAQSAASGYNAFNAKAGFEQISSTVGWNHVIDKNWSVTTRVGVTHLVGDAADSPVVKKKTNPVAMASFNYSF